MPLRQVYQMRVQPSIPNVHPDHHSVSSVLTCRICSRIFWEHQANLIRRKNAVTP